MLEVNEYFEGKVKSWIQAKASTLGFIGKPLTSVNTNNDEGVRVVTR